MSVRNYLAQRAMLAFVGVITMVAVSACGSDSGASAVSKVDARTDLYAVEDFESAGFKVVKDYDVEGLTGASAAVFGFLRSSNGSEPQSYELRFYDSHESAVELGTAFAEEVTGEDAVLIKADMSWSEGSREQKEPAGEGGGTIAFYWEYAIYGNVVMLCEGDWPEQSLEVCGELQSALDPESTS